MRPCLRPSTEGLKSWPVYQVLLLADLAGIGTTTPLISDRCPGRVYGRWYLARRLRLHRLAALEMVLLAPVPRAGGSSRTWMHRRYRSSPARLGPPTTARGASLLTCGDVEDNPGPAPSGWGRRTTQGCRNWWWSLSAAWAVTW